MTTLTTRENNERAVLDIFKSYNIHENESLSYIILLREMNKKISRSNEENNSILNSMVKKT